MKSGLSTSLNSPESETMPYIVVQIEKINPEPLVKQLICIY